MMTMKKAHAEAMRRWGKTAMVERHKLALTEEAKAPLRERLAALRVESKPETKKERAELSGEILRYRCNVGVVVNIAGMFSAYEIKGQGDTFEAAFAHADKR